MEAGSSTNSPHVVFSNVRTRASKDASTSQINQPKSTNQPLEDGDEDVNMENEEQKDSSESQNSQKSSQKPRLNKAWSHATNGGELEQHLLKNSTKGTSKNMKTSKSVEMSVEPSQSEELPQNNDGNSSVSLTGSTGEEVVPRRSTLQKEASTNSQLKTRRADSKLKVKSQEKKNLEVFSSDIKNTAPRIKISKAKAEEICLKWIKSLIEIEARSNARGRYEHSDKDMPEFCSNRI